MIKIIFYIPNKIIETFRRVILGMKMAFYKRSYLNRTGYMHSKVNDSLKSIDDRYIPWMNYSINQFLEERLNKNLNVFEYGSGASTMYWAEKTKSVVSIEYDQDWYKKVKELIQFKDNAQIHYIDLKDNYTLAIDGIGADKSYDLIIIDGRERVKCAIHSFPHLSVEGVLLLDDSKRSHYQEAFDFFKNKGFNELTFHGIKPTGFGVDTTTIFYKSENNCLGI